MKEDYKENWKEAVIRLKKDGVNENNIISYIKSCYFNTRPREDIQNRINAVLLLNEDNNIQDDLNDWHVEALALYYDKLVPVPVISHYIAMKYFPNDSSDKAKDVRKNVVRYLKKNIKIPKNPNIPEPQNASTSNKMNTSLKPDGSIESEKQVVISPEQKEVYEKNLRNEQYLLEYHGYSDEFEVVNAKSSIWEAQVKGGKIETLCSSKLTVKKKTFSPELIAEAFGDMLLNKYHPFADYNFDMYYDANGDRCAILSIADLHLGKLAWAPETGENYDQKIAQKRFFFIVEKAISEMKSMNLEKIIFFWSQDFFNYDNTLNETTAGTKQDTDVRWQKLFNLGCDMLIEAIKRLSKVAPVQTFYTRSNHDEQASYYAVNVLWAYFHDFPNIEISRSPAGRKYVRYGINLFGFGHGDKEGKRIEGLMQQEASSDWGKTKFREFFLGHYHSLNQYETNGIIFRYLQSPTGTDSWHYQSGYIGAGKAAQLFIRDKKTGPVTQSEIYVPFN